MSGQTIDGAGGYVSHIRTWYMSVYQIPFGIAGSLGAPSITSQYLKSIRRFFPVDKSEDDRRAPVSWQMIRLFVRTAEWRRRVKGERKWEDAGVAAIIVRKAEIQSGAVDLHELARARAPQRNISGRPCLQGQGNGNCKTELLHTVQILIIRLWPHRKDSYRLAVR